MYFQPTDIFFQHYELSKIQNNEPIAAIKYASVESVQDVWELMDVCSVENHHIMM